MAAVMMVSERQEELKEKIAKLRRVTAKGDGYERIVGSGADLTEKMEKSKDDFESDSDKAQQVCCFFEDLGDGRRTERGEGGGDIA